MVSISPIHLISRRIALLLCAVCLPVLAARAQTDPLPSWNDGAAKQAIVAFVTETTTAGRPSFVPEPSASPPSTRTARCGSRSRCTPR